MLRGRSLGCAAQFPARLALHTFPAPYTRCNVCRATARWVYLGFCQRGRGATSLAFPKIPAQQQGQSFNGRLHSQWLSIGIRPVSAA
jgi:hypothetical protein